MEELENINLNSDNFIQVKGKSTTPNARLIAVAPELLIAIKQAVDLALNRKVINQSILESWQKAIAKAEGSL